MHTNTKTPPACESLFYLRSLWAQLRQKCEGEGESVPLDEVNGELEAEQNAHFRKLLDRSQRQDDQKRREREKKREREQERIRREREKGLKHW